jgi:hypothetical protein
VPGAELQFDKAARVSPALDERQGPARGFPAGGHRPAPSSGPAALPDAPQVVQVRRAGPASIPLHAEATVSPERSSAQAPLEPLLIPGSQATSKGPALISFPHQADAAPDRKESGLRQQSISLSAVANATGQSAPAWPEFVDPEEFEARAADLPGLTPMQARRSAHESTEASRAEVYLTSVTVASAAEPATSDSHALRETLPPKLFEATPAVTVADRAIDRAALAFGARLTPVTADPLQPARSAADALTGRAENRHTTEPSRQFPPAQPVPDPSGPGSRRAAEADPMLERHSAPAASDYEEGSRAFVRRVTAPPATPSEVNASAGRRLNYDPPPSRRGHNAQPAEAPDPPEHSRDAAAERNPEPHVPEARPHGIAPVTSADGQVQVTHHATGPNPLSPVPPPIIPRDRVETGSAPAVREPAHGADPEIDRSKDLQPETGRGPATPAREIRLEFTQGGRRVEVNLSDRAGEVNVAVRTPDRRLAERLRGDLPELSSRLAEVGVRAETWHPPAASGGDPREIREFAARSGGEQPDAPFGRQGHEQQRQREDQPRSHRWIDEDSQELNEKGREFEWYLPGTT